MEILNNFGFEPVLFLAQIINFLIIYILLKKFLYKSVLKVLSDRKDKIATGIKNAEDSARLLEETILKEEKILNNAQEKAKQLILDAKTQSDIMLKQSEIETNKKIDIMLNEAREQIKNESSIAQKQLESNISKIAISFLEKSLQGFFGKKEQEIIMKNALKKLKN